MTSKRYHECEGLKNQKQLAYGSDFTIYFKDHSVWVISTDEEYETEIKYCPFCGERLRNPEPEKQKEAKK